MYNQGWEWCLKVGLYGKQNHNKKVILWELNQNLVNKLRVCVCVCVCVSECSVMSDSLRLHGL